MRTHLIQLLLALAPAVGAGEQDGAQDAHPASPDHAREPVVGLKYTDPIRVAYLQHIGPYWMVGPIFRSVGQYMVDHDQAGDMFARYLDNPAEVAARSLRSEIGFVVEGDLQPESPFKVGWRERELVAFLVVDGPHVKTRRYHLMMYSWIEARGHKSVGPITEVYSDPFAKRTEPRTQRMEIQILLEESQAKHRPPEPRGLARTNVRHGHAGEGSPPVTADPERAGVGRAPETDAKEDSRVPAAGVTNAKEDSRVPAAGETDARVDPRTRAAADRPAPSPDAKRVVPIRRLIAQSRFDRIAEQLMPQDDPIPRGLEIWFGQMVLRIGAAAKGIKRIYPGEDESVSAIAEALTRRYRVVSRHFNSDPLDQVVVRVDSATDPLAARKKAVMRELDGLLAGIALRTVDAKKSLEKLAEVLQQVHDLLRTDREHG